MIAIYSVQLCTCKIEMSLSNEHKVMLMVDVVFRLICLCVMTKVDEYEKVKVLYRHWTLTVYCDCKRSCKLFSVIFEKFFLMKEHF